MKTVKLISTAALLMSAILFAVGVKGQAATNKNTDTIPVDSYDNFNEKPNYSPSYIVVKSRENGKLLYEHTLENGNCTACYDKLTTKADSCYKRNNYTDAATLYTAAFTLNDNKGKVKHRLILACCFVKLNNFDGAFENLDRIVFAAKFHDIYEITNNDCFKPLQPDARWAKLIEGLKKNLEEVQEKLNTGTSDGQ